MVRRMAAPRAGSRRFHRGFERGFERMRDGYVALLDLAARAGGSSCRSSPCWCSRSAAAMFLLVGRDFFPAIDGGQIQLHVRAPAGTRIEATERIFQAVEDKIREVIPESERELIVDNIGLPARAYNLAFTDGSTIGVNDGVILVALKEGHAPTADYVRKLRASAAGRVPGGDVLFPGRRHRHPDPQFRTCRRRSTCAPSATTGRTTCASPRSCGGALPPFPASPTRICSRRSTRRRSMPTIDRARAAQLGLNANTHRHQHQCQPELVGAGDAEFLDRSDIGNSLLSWRCRRRRRSVSSLERSRQHAGLDGDRLRRRADVPVPGLLSNVATFKRDSVPTNANQTNIQPVYEVYASVQGRDLGSVVRARSARSSPICRSSSRPATRSR